MKSLILPFSCQSQEKVGLFAIVLDDMKKETDTKKSYPTLPLTKLHSVT
jgi:hypothetical protein